MLYTGANMLCMSEIALHLTDTYFHVVEHCIMCTSHWVLYTLIAAMTILHCKATVAEVMPRQASLDA